MGSGMTFGGCLKQSRMEQGKTLREFCFEHGFDPGNMSKMERDLLAAPQSEIALARLARALGIAQETQEWEEFYDLAAISCGQIPRAILSDEEAVAKLPLFFRTLRGRHVTREDVERLVEVIKNS